MVNLLSGIKSASSAKRQARIDDSLLHFEAKLGGQLFGKLPAGADRQFFVLDNHTFVWHEAWTDQSGHKKSVTTRYIIRPGGHLVKTTGDGEYRAVSDLEARRLLKTAKAYQTKVASAYQKILNR
jgi:hypothetical protein